jgi:hypothetical protein
MLYLLFEVAKIVEYRSKRIGDEEVGPSDIYRYM